MPLKSDAYLRHAQHYLEVARTAGEIYEKGNESVVKGLALFDSELSHIRAGQTWSAVNWETNDSAARMCDDYPNAPCANIG